MAAFLIRVFHSDNVLVFVQRYTPAASMAGGVGYFALSTVRSDGGLCCNPAAMTRRVQLGTLQRGWNMVGVNVTCWNSTIVSYPNAIIDIRLFPELAGYYFNPSCFA